MCGRWSSQPHLAELSWSRSIYALGVLAYHLTTQFVFGDSVQYHWNRCAPEREFLCWRCPDQSGCLALVVVGYLAGIPMGYHCHENRYFALLVHVYFRRALRRPWCFDVVHPEAGGWCDLEHNHPWRATRGDTNGALVNTFAPRHAGSRADLPHCNFLDRYGHRRVHW